MSLSGYLMNMSESLSDAGLVEVLMRSGLGIVGFLAFLIVLALVMAALSSDR